MAYRIPFNKPCLTGDEFRYVADAIARGHIADHPQRRELQLFRKATASVDLLRVARLIAPAITSP